MEDPGQQEPFLSGTYYNPIQQASGQAGASALVLVDSHNYSAARFGEGSDAGGVPRRFAIGAPANPESSAKGLLVKGVDLNVHIFQNTSSWFGAAVIHLGLRIVVMKQDNETGAALAHPDYSMWANAGGLQSGGPDYWANGRQNCWELRKSFVPNYGTSSTNNAALATWVRARPFFNRRLAEDEGLFLWVETHTNSLNIDLLNPFCRTLVQVPD